jgi:hypothetical protein
MLTDDQLNKIFGNPIQYCDDTGTLGPEYEKLWIVTIPLIKPLTTCWNPNVQVTKVRCNKLIAPILKSALDEVLTNPFTSPTINDYGGCFVFRMQRKSTKLSRHSWGTAIDLDVADNPFGSDPKVDPLTIEIFAKYGFAWGGNFKGTRKDGMHFEFADLSKLPLSA